MDRPHPSPRKTPLAREWLERRDPRLDRARRSLLITVDGRRSGDDLVRLAQGLGLGADAVADLQRQGLIAWAHGEDVPAQARAAAAAPPSEPRAAAEALPSGPRAAAGAPPSGPRAAAPPSDARAAAAAPPPDPRAAPAPAPRPAPSLAAAKLYALDLATLMLGGRDADLRALAGEVQTREALVAWCELAARRVAEHAGPDRAERFLEKTGAMLAPA